VRPRELSDTEAHNHLVAALGALVAAAPEQTIVIDRASLRYDAKLFVELYETGAIAFSLAGRVQ
jgi:hypothetical protein